MTLVEDVCLGFEPTKLGIKELLLLQKARVSYVKGESVVVDSLELMLLLREVQIDREMQDENRRADE